MDLKLDRVAEWDPNSGEPFYLALENENSYVGYPDLECVIGYQSTILPPNLLNLARQFIQNRYPEIDVSTGFPIKFHTWSHPDMSRSPYPHVEFPDLSDGSFAGNIYSTLRRIESITTWIRLHEEDTYPNDFGFIPSILGRYLHDVTRTAWLPTYRHLLARYQTKFKFLLVTAIKRAAGEKKSHVEDSEEKDMEDEEEEDPEIIESDIELDENDVVAPDHDPPQKMGDPTVDVTVESRDSSQVAKMLAMEAISEGKYEEALEHLTKAIVLNPTSAVMYETRATVYIKMKKPNAAIRDANAALEISSDYAKGYKSRGIAQAMLGQWGAATKDLHLALNMEYDEEISAVLNKVEQNAHKIEEHHRKYEKFRKDREDRKMMEREGRHIAEAQDPELMGESQEPEVMAALRDVMKNPANMDED